MEPLLCAKPCAKKLTHLTRCIFRATKEVRFLHYYYHPIYR